MNTFRLLLLAQMTLFPKTKKICKANEAFHSRGLFGVASVPCRRRPALK